MAGVVIASSSPAVAARCAFARPGTGVATTQNLTDPRLGPALLDAMADGASAAEAVDRVAAGAPAREHRQLAALDAHGGAGAYTGERALGRHGHRLGADCVAAAQPARRRGRARRAGDRLRRRAGRPPGERACSPRSKPGWRRAARRGRCAPPAC